MASSMHIYSGMYSSTSERSEQAFWLAFALYGPTGKPPKAAPKAAPKAPVSEGPMCPTCGADTELQGRRAAWMGCRC